MGQAMTRSRPDQMMRLYRKDKAEWDLVRLVHEHVEVQGTTSRIAPHMIHYGNDTIEKLVLSLQTTTKHLPFHETIR